MHKKIIYIITILVIFITGCTKIDDNIDNIINTIMIKENIKSNTVSTGYELYIPIGVYQTNDSEYNQVFKVRDSYLYLYVDIVSYHYKNELNYKSNGDYSYYYKEINNNGKTGYIGVNKVDDNEYYCEIVYNYSKIEFYSTKKDLSYVISNALIIQNSINYIDNLIKLELEKSKSDGRELTYELDKPDDKESNFSKYLQEYVPEDDAVGELPTED